MKRMYYYLLALFALSMSIVSCENAQEMELLPADENTVAATAAAVPNDGSSPTYFTLQIEGGNYSVGIINRFYNPEQVTIVTAAQCPFIYYYTIPSGVTPELTDIEIIATNSSMRYIRGFADQYGCYSHADTYHYAYFWNRPEILTAIFEASNYRPDPLPPGVEDGISNMPRAVDVVIDMERMGGAFELTANYTDFDGNPRTTAIGSHTVISNALASSSLEIEIRNTTSYSGQLTFSTATGTNVMRFSGYSVERVTYGLRSAYGTMNLRIY